MACRTSKNLAVFSAIAAILAGTGIVVWRLVWNPIYSLPALADVESITVLWFYDRHSQTGRFDLPKNHWSDLWSNLSPSRFDPSPAKWQVLADIEISTTDGCCWRLSLFNLSGGQAGAFRVGPADGGGRYYRGGHTAQWLTLLRAAALEKADVPRSQKNGGEQP
jgi:hypothetical protein